MDLQKHLINFLYRFGAILLGAVLWLAVFAAVAPKGTGNALEAPAIFMLILLVLATNLFAKTRLTASNLATYLFLSFYFSFIAYNYACVSLIPIQTCSDTLNFLAGNSMVGKYFRSAFFLIVLVLIGNIIYEHFFSKKEKTKQATQVESSPLEPFWFKIFLAVVFAIILASFVIAFSRGV